MEWWHYLNMPCASQGGRAGHCWWRDGCQIGMRGGTGRVWGRHRGEGTTLALALQRSLHPQLSQFLMPLHSMFFAFSAPTSPVFSCLFLIGFHDPCFHAQLAAKSCAPIIYVSLTLVFLVAVFSCQRSQSSTQEALALQQRKLQQEFGRHPTLHNQTGTPRASVDGLQPEDSEWAGPGGWGWRGGLVEGMGKLGVGR